MGHEIDGVLKVSTSLPFSFKEDPCCELHKVSCDTADSHHFHFLVADKMATRVAGKIDPSIVIKQLGLAGAQSFDLFSQSAPQAIFRPVYFPQDIFLSTYSGLSPPAVL